MSMSLRTQTLASYHRLLKRTAQLEDELASVIPNPGGVFLYVRQRFRAASWKRAGLVRHSEDSNVAYPMGAAAVDQRVRLSAAAAALPVSSAPVGGHHSSSITDQLELIDTYCDAMGLVHRIKPLQAIVVALSTGSGNRACRLQLERSFLDAVEFEIARAERNEMDDTEADARQNRVLQTVIAPYASTLAKVAETCHRECSDDESLLETVHSPAWLDSLRVAVSSHRAGVETVVLTQGDTVIVLELDEPRNRQTIYLHYTKPYSFGIEPIERVETIEPPGLRDCVMNARYGALATRILDALREETPLHRSRGTAICGHGQAGAIGLALALMMHADGFDIRNTVTFGAPKLVEGARSRLIDAVNLMRCSIAGDPLIDLPVTGDEGSPFVHFGEHLILEDAWCRTGDNRSEGSVITNARSRKEAECTDDAIFYGEDDSDRSGTYSTHTTAGDDDEESDLRTKAALPDPPMYEHCQPGESAFSVYHYRRCLVDPELPLSYSSGDGQYESVWDEGELSSKTKRQQEKVTPKEQDW